MLHLRQKKFSLTDDGEVELWSIPMSLEVLPVNKDAKKERKIVKHMFNKPKEDFILKSVQLNQSILVRASLNYSRILFSDDYLLYSLFFRALYNWTSSMSLHGR